jgi:hypothetical protein
MSVNDASWIIIGNSRVTIRVVASLSDDSRGVIYDRNVFIVQATGCGLAKLLTNIFKAQCILGVITISITTLSIMALSVTTLSLMTLSITTLSIMTLSMTTPSITTLSIMALSVTTLSVKTLSLMTLSVKTLNIITLSIMMCIVMLSITQLTLSLVQNLSLKYNIAAA